MPNVSGIMKQLKRERARVQKQLSGLETRRSERLRRRTVERARAENGGSSPRRREQRSPLHRGSVGRRSEPKRRTKVPSGFSRIAARIRRSVLGSVLVLCRASRREQLCLVYASCRMVRLTGGSMLRRVLAEIGMGIGLVAALLVCPTNAAAANLQKSAPDFTLSDSKGASVRLSDYKGRVVLLDFWATWCHGCKTEIPWYMEFQNKYKDKGLSVIGISMDEDGWKSVKPFVEENKMNYAVVVGNEDLAKLYAVDALPMTLLIDRDGKIADSHAGMVDKDAFENEIRVLLQDNGKNATK
jgi:peroxiredoxin